MGVKQDVSVFATMLVAIHLAPAILAVFLLYPKLGEDHHLVFFGGSFLMSLVASLMTFSLRKTSATFSYLGVAFCFITFTAYIDTFLALSVAFEDFPLGRFYMDKGEKYFKSSYGFACLMWDGTFHVVLQFSIAFCALTKRDYRYLALVWAGSVINSMPPLLFGAATGPYSEDIQAAAVFNAPYIFFPIGVAMYLMKTTPRIKHKPLYYSLALDIIAEVIIIIFHLIRVLAVLGSQCEVSILWKTEYEPFWSRSTTNVSDKQDRAFMFVQAIQWAWWFVPYHIYSIVSQISKIRSNQAGDLGYDLSLKAIVLGGYLQSVACYWGVTTFDMKYDDGRLGLKLRLNQHSFWYESMYGCVIYAALDFVKTYVSMDTTSDQFKERLVEAQKEEEIVEDDVNDLNTDLNQ